MDEKELQEKLIVYQLLQKHMESLTQSAVLLERRFEEAEASSQVLKDMKGDEKEILIPLGSGIFTHGKITGSRKLMIDVGAGLFLEKDADSAGTFLEERKKEIEKLAGEMQQEMIEVSSRINALAMEIESSSKEDRAQSSEKKSGKATAG